MAWSSPSEVGLVPILRAGLGMIDPVLDLIPSAEVWHLGLYRDEATAEPVGTTASSRRAGRWTWR